MRSPSQGDARQTRVETRVLRALDDDDEKPSEARQTALLSPARSGSR